MRFFICVFIAFGILSCANQTSPNGGPQDKKAPELKISNPSNNQKNFNEKTIILDFDEYVKLKDPSEEIMIAPSIGKDVKFIARKNRITILPKLKWKENTTYSISFRDGIQDVTESNSALNLRLAFSTGPEIDSLSIQGKVEEIFKEEIPDKITVALYSSDTFNIFNHQPEYFTKANKQGRFSINNLKSGQYFIYAFEDKNKNLKVESKGEKFGYLIKPINLIGKSDSVTIPLIRVDSRPIKITSIRRSDRLSTVRINKDVNSVKVEPSDKELFTMTFGSKRDELLFYKSTTEIEDSLKLDLQLTDSIGSQKDTTVYLKFSRTKMPKEKFKITYSKTEYDYEDREVKLEATTNKPLKQITLDSIYIQIDSTTFQPLRSSEIKTDSMSNKITINTFLELKNEDPKEKKLISPLIIFGKGAFVSIEADSTKATTHIIKIKNEEELGSLSIEVQTTEKNYIIELLGRNNEPVSSNKNIKSYTFKYLEPQEYKIRITIDANNNNKWDTGNYYLNKEPEKVIIHRNFEGKTSIPIRANWEVGPIKIKF